MIPESRKDEGLLLGRPVRENVSLASLATCSRIGFVRRGAERRGRDALERSPDRPRPRGAGRHAVRRQPAEAAVRAGVLGRPRLLIADEPTRGIDVGAKRYIYELLTELAADGTAVLLISSEIEEVLGLSHRVAGDAAGRIAAELRART